MIERVDHHNFHEVLPLIRAYQEFYNVIDIDDKKNRAHFGRFLLDNSRGILHIVKSATQVIGFSTIYFCFSSTRAEEIAILNDLYVKPEFRRKGYGKQLIENAAAVAASRGIKRVQWLTAQENKDAQKLYDSLDIVKSDWCLYTKDI